MRINFPYGVEQISVDVPDNWINGRCYRPHPLQPSINVGSDLENALSGLPAGQDLRSLAQGKKTCSIAVDGNEPAMILPILPALLAFITGNTSIRANAITIVVANRPWRPFNRGTLKRIIDGSTLENFRVVLHDPRDTTSVASIGTSSRQIPLTVNKAYLEGDLKIVVGGVRPDVFHGFTGGRQVIMPGLSGIDTIRAMYSYDHVADPNARWGVYRDNPFHMTGIEAINAAGCDLGIAATLTAEGLIEKIFAGHFGGSHLQAMNAMKQSLTVTVKEPMDIVVTGGGGDPYDRTLMQLVTTLSAVKPVLKPGGTIVVTASLASGFGTQEFCDLVTGYGSVQRALEVIAANREYVPGQWLAQRMLTILREHEVILFNKDLEDQPLWVSGVTPARDLNSAVHSAMESHGQRCKIVALPEGPFGIGEVA